MVVSSLGISFTTSSASSLASSTHDHQADHGPVPVARGRLGLGQANQLVPAQAAVLQREQLPGGVELPEGRQAASLQASHTPCHHALQCRRYSYKSSCLILGRHVYPSGWRLEHMPMYGSEPGFKYDRLCDPNQDIPDLAVCIV